eukprot:TRINITY_DN14497_c0_g1_i3.p1 TRINITY_DN14497_c0_g1~~TRINITY_DN14497_c0_g1_i3.p1  ORF type:complete len:167 (+),score=28.82 TRINITY_DN14497_c0_g1_i3:1-501(+)
MESDKATSHHSSEKEVKSRKRVKDLSSHRKRKLQRFYQKIRKNGLDEFEGLRLKTICKENNPFSQLSSFVTKVEQNINCENPGNIRSTTKFTTGVFYEVESTVGGEKITNSNHSIDINSLCVKTNITQVSSQEMMLRYYERLLQEIGEQIQVLELITKLVDSLSNF